MKNKIKIQLSLLAILLIGMNSLKAQDTYINGSFSVFGEVGVFGNLQTDVDAQLFFQNGSTMHMLGNATTINSGSEIYANNTSTQSGTGRILFVGAAAQTLEGGNSSAIGGAQPSLINIAVNNTNNLTLTNTNARITSGLDLIAGHVILGNNNLELGTAAAITNANQTKYVVTNGIGFLAKENFSTAFNFPVGRATADYTPAIITPIAVDNVFVNVKNYTESASTEFQTDDGVDRTWNIYSTTGVGANINLQHNHATNAVNFNINDAFVTRYYGAGWEDGTGFNAASSAGTIPNSSTRNRLYSATATTPNANGAFFSKASRLLSPLPLYLTFNAQPLKPMVSKLNWTINNPENVNYFDVYTSTDAIQWNKIGNVIAQSPSTLQYTFLHQNAINGNNFYKINLIDQTGASIWSAVKLVKFIGGSNNVSIYPNPSFDVVIIENLNNSNIQLISIEGKEIDFSIKNLDNKSIIDVSTLASGTYFIVVTNTDGLVNKTKIIINH